MSFKIKEFMKSSKRRIQKTQKIDFEKTKHTFAKTTI
jgi:hypothetical protein